MPTFATLRTYVCYQAHIRRILLVYVFVGRGPCSSLGRAQLSLSPRPWARLESQVVLGLVRPATICGMPIQRLHGYDRWYPHVSGSTVWLPEFCINWTILTISNEKNSKPGIYKSYRQQQFSYTKYLYSTPYKKRYYFSKVTSHNTRLICYQNIILFFLAS